ncbi:hypothetical protein [Patulibacter minatonensis]|uniref:hypothetical protein n=1 Tax=Patulibacter minatonensis TaxID=298163 RepID=UPI00047DB208|nr:hypothetical protein [Patulibacter minatonensis]
MSRPRTRRPRRRTVAAAVVLVATIVVVAWLVLGGGSDDDELAELRALPDVATATTDDGDVLVGLRAGAAPRQIATVLDRAPDDAGRTTLRLGRASLEVERGDPADDELLRAFVALSAVRSPGGIATIERLSADQRVEVEVRRPEQAAPLAREMLARLTTQGRPVRGIDRIEVALQDAFQSDPKPVTLGRLGATDGRVERAMLDAAIALRERRPRVAVVGSSIELRPRADGAGDAGAAWRAAAAAIDLPAADRRDAQIYVDEASTEDGRERTHTLLSGPAGADADRALAFLRSVSGVVSAPFARTDLSFAQGDARTLRAARSLAASAEDAGARRLRLSVEADGARETSGDEDRSGRGAADDTARTQIEDTPARVRALLPGVARTRRLGIRALVWTRPAGALARLTIATPGWLDEADPADDPSKVLRRLSRAVRALGWQDTARFGLPLPRGTCEDHPSAHGVTQIESTSDGRTRTMGTVNDCTGADDLAAGRAAWNATAD